MRLFADSWIAATILLYSALWFPTPTLGANCEELSSLTMANATVTAAAEVAAGGNLPAYCQVKVNAKPAADSEIKIEIWLPAVSNWNGKFAGTGNGGYSGAIGYGDMRSALRQGYATAGSNTGHDGADLGFGSGHPEKIKDWAYRAVHLMTEAAKLVLHRYYEKPAAHAYFTGCSTGGHQALMEAQRYPADYDGIVAGDPGNDRIRLNVGFLW
jgi:feruloyl esterase